MATTEAAPNSVQSLGAQEQCKYKNRLQQFTQRAGMQLPVYQTFNEGRDHAPQFRSTVIVDGSSFVSPNTFFRRREAEQYVAQFAFENVVAKAMQEGLTQINNIPVFCKSILHECAKKLKKEPPTYTPSKTEGLLPVFNTSVNFDGKTFVGGFFRNKKDAEQFGARCVIEWILGGSHLGIGQGSGL